jgi:hypothetical protein
MGNFMKGKSIRKIFIIVKSAICGGSTFGESAVMNTDGSLLSTIFAALKEPRDFKAGRALQRRTCPL